MPAGDKVARPRDEIDPLDVGVEADGLHRGASPTGFLPPLASYAVRSKVSAAVAAEELLAALEAVVRGLEDLRAQHWGSLAVARRERRFRRPRLHCFGRERRALRRACLASASFRAD